MTGSTEIGRLLVGQGARQLFRTSVELGGTARLIVFEDADLDKAVDGALLARCETVVKPAQRRIGSSPTKRWPTSSLVGWSRG